jgi:serine/threonine protein phosphatase PrpC
MRRSIIEIVTSSIIGRRPYNEDRVFVHARETDIFVAVYDGHGGDIVSSLLRDRLYPAFRRYLAGMSVEMAMRKSYKEMDEIAASLGIPDCGSTAVTCYIRREDGKRVIYTANVGDSEAVLYSNTYFSVLSEIHNEDNETEKRRVERLGGQFLKGYVMGELNMTRAIGDHGIKRYVCSSPSVSKMDMEGDSKYLLLASDGLYDVLEYKDVYPILSARMPIQEKANRLVQLAYDKGSSDNISVVLLSL